MTSDGATWEIWGTDLIFLRAGCYQMTSAWPGGHWQTTFAVGR